MQYDWIGMYRKQWYTAESEIILYSSDVLYLVAVSAAGLPLTSVILSQYARIPQCAACCSNGGPIIFLQRHRTGGNYIDWHFNSTIYMPDCRACD